MRRAVVTQGSWFWICMAAWAVATSAGAHLQRPTTYHVEALRDGPSALQNQFTPKQLQLLEKLNRSDIEHLGRLRKVVVPDSWGAEELAHAVLPAYYPSGEPYPKLLVVYQPAQIFGGYEFGRLVRWGPISSGERNNPTPVGLFHLNWRAKEHASTRNAEWLMRWTFNFENRVGLSFHEYALPGRPASHSCIRLLGRDARWLFDWGEPWTLDASETRIVESGTPVFVVGCYDFNAPAPWHVMDEFIRDVELPELPHSLVP